jgi:hypothetical protein
VTLYQSTERITLWNIVHEQSHKQRNKYEILQKKKISEQLDHSGLYFAFFLNITLLFGAMTAKSANMIMFSVESILSSTYLALANALDSTHFP